MIAPLFLGMYEFFLSAICSRRMTHAHTHVLYLPQLAPPRPPSVLARLPCRLCFLEARVGHVAPAQPSYAAKLRMTADQPMGTRHPEGGPVVPIVVFSRIRCSSHFHPQQGAADSSSSVLHPTSRLCFALCQRFCVFGPRRCIFLAFFGGSCQHTSSPRCGPKNDSVACLRLDTLCHMFPPLVLPLERKLHADAIPFHNERRCRCLWLMSIVARAVLLLHLHGDA